MQISIGDAISAFVVSIELDGKTVSAQSLDLETGDISYFEGNNLVTGKGTIRVLLESTKIDLSNLGVEKSTELDTLLIQVKQRLANFSNDAEMAAAYDKAKALLDTLTK